MANEGPDAAVADVNNDGKEDVFLQEQRVRPPNYG